MFWKHLKTFPGTWSDMHDQHERAEIYLDYKARLEKTIEDARKNGRTFDDTALGKFKTGFAFSQGQKAGRSKEDTIKFTNRAKEVIATYEKAHGKDNR
jgi:hypothetical protein